MIFSAVLMKSSKRVVKAKRLRRHPAVAENKPIISEHHNWESKHHQLHPFHLHLDSSCTNYWHPSRSLNDGPPGASMPDHAMLGCIIYQYIFLSHYFSELYLDFPIRRLLMSLSMSREHCLLLARIQYSVLCIIIGLTEIVSASYKYQSECVAPGPGH